MSSSSFERNSESLQASASGKYHSPIEKSRRHHSVGVLFATALHLAQTPLSERTASSGLRPEATNGHLKIEKRGQGKEDDGCIGRHCVPPGESLKRREDRPPVVVPRQGADETEFALLTCSDSYVAYM